MKNSSKSEIMKVIQKLLIFTLIFCIYVRFISGLSLDNNLLPGGVDTPAHLYRVWHVTNFGVDKWDHYWLGGTPFLRFYPPFLPWLGGILGNIFGFLFAYKLMNNLFFALTPLVFFYFLKEFRMSNEKIIIATIFFSLMPIYAYFQADGRWSSIINMFFILIYWIFLKRAIDGDKKSILLSGITLGFCILTQLTTTVFLIPITLIWVFFYRMNIDIVYKLIPIFALAFILTSFWSVQFLINTLSLSKSTGYSYAGILNPSRISNMPQELLSRIIISLGLYSRNNISIILFIGVTAIISLLSIYKIKEKITREFIIIAIVIGIMVLFVRFKRSFIFLPIPLSFMVAEGIYLFGKKIKIILFSILFILLLMSFFSIRPNLYPFPEYPTVPNDGRVLFLPFSLEFPNLYKYSIVLAPINGNENIFEWGWVTEETNYIVVYSNNKNLYNDLLAYPEKIAKDNYYNLLKDGYVNYIVVNKDYGNLTDYFEESNFTNVIDETKTHIVFGLNPKATYIEINNISTGSEFIKKNDEIFIKTICSPGKLTIKETYDSFWKGTINDKSLELEQNEHSFMETNISENGPCEIKLKFELPKYYSIANLISVSGFVITVIVLVFSFSIFPLNKKKYHK
jgi:hypothetical protein